MQLIHNRSMFDLVHRYRFYILGLLFVTTIFCFWPGIIMHDSNMQYLEAVSGVYSDHHPPLMAFVWHYLNMLYPGTGPMFLLQIAVLYIAIYVLMLTANFLHLRKPAIATILLLLLPIYPQILIYAVVVLKDVHFAVCMLLTHAILAYYTLSQKKPNLLMLHLIFTILVYGAAVKYQGQYVALVPAIWLGALHARDKSLLFKIIIGALVYTIVIVSIYLINHTLVARSGQKYAWEYVKIYDLAAISVQTNQELIPAANLTPNYTFSKLKQRFRYPGVDPLVFMQDPIFQITKDKEQMQKLWNVWFAAIKQYPGVYVGHRLNIIRYILLESPAWSTAVKDVPLRFENHLMHNPFVYKLVQKVFDVVFFVFMSHLPVVFVGLAYIFLAIKTWKKNLAAKVLFGFISTALLLVVIVMGMSMSGTPRYTFMSVLLIQASHIFAYRCLSKSQEIAA